MQKDFKTKLLELFIKQKVSEYLKCYYKCAIVI